MNHSVVLQGYYTNTICDMCNFWYRKNPSGVRQ